MASRRVSGGDATSFPQIAPTASAGRAPASEDSIALPPIFSAAQRAATAYESLDYDLLQLNVPEHGSFVDDFVSDKYSRALLRRPKEAGDAAAAVAVAFTESKSKPKKEPSSGAGAFKRDSLKFVYSTPLWPHERILSKKLDKLFLRNLMLDKLFLRNLMLDDSNLRCLRDLGSSLPNIVTLSVLRCSLKSLDGAGGLPNLENLFAAENNISTPSPLAYLDKIRYVDLSGNDIAEFDGFRFLSACTQLRCLKLADTVLAERKEFHPRLRGMLPSLRELYPKISFRGRKPTAAATEKESCKVFTEESLIETSNSAVATAASAMDTELNREEILSKQLDLKLEHEWVIISDMLEEKESEQRLRDVFRPEKRNFKLRGSSSAVPTTIEEMDAMLEDLDDKQAAKEERRRRRQRQAQGEKAELVELYVRGQDQNSPVGGPPGSSGSSQSQSRECFTLSQSSSYIEELRTPSLRGAPSTSSISSRSVQEDGDGDEWSVRSSSASTPRPRPRN